MYRAILPWHSDVRISEPAQESKVLGKRTPYKQMKYKLAIVVLSLVTSNSYENVRRILNPKNMDLMVHHQCGTSLFGKPSRLRNILRKTGIHRSEAIYIGDEIRDLEAANTENIHFGAVSWGYTRADALIEYSPTEIFSCMDEIVKKIAQQNAPTDAPNDGAPLS